MIKVRTTTYNQNDEAVQVFVGSLVVHRRPATSGGAGTGPAAWKRIVGERLLN